MEGLETETGIAIKNEERSEKGNELLIGLKNLNEHDGVVVGGVVNYEKKEDADIAMHMNDQDKLDVPSLVEICKQQLIVILKDMCADLNGSDEKASFFYHLNRLRNAVTVVDLHNYIAVFGPCLSYNKLPSTWNISVCDYLKQQLNILRAADSQQSPNGYVSYLDLHNDLEDIINEKKGGNSTTTGSISMQGNINSNNLNSKFSMKGSSIHMNSANSTSNLSGNVSGRMNMSNENTNLIGCYTLGDNEDNTIVEDYYDCLMRTKLSDETSNCLKYMMNSKNDSLSNTEVENVISYLKKYEVKSNKNYCNFEDELIYSKDSDYEYHEDYLKDKTLYDSDIDDNNIFGTNLIDSSRNINDSNSTVLNMSMPNSVSANNNSNNNNNNNNNNINHNNNSNNNNSNSNLNNKNYNMKYDVMKKNNNDTVNTWTRACTEGHPEYLPRIPGVRFNPKKQQWLAAWNDNTREIRRYFSVKQYGFEQARILAVKARQEAEKAGARCKPMFHVHGRKAADSASNDVMKNNNGMMMEDGSSARMTNNNIAGNNNIGNISSSDACGNMGIMNNNVKTAFTNNSTTMNSGGIIVGVGKTQDPMNKKNLLKNENNKGIKRGRGRPPKRKISEDSQLSLDDMEQNLCKNGDNAELMEAIDSFDKNCTRPMKGVSYNDRKGSWLAYWSIGKNFQMKRFPIKKLGFEKAKELAIQCRLEAEQAGATTTENRTKRIRNLITLNSENTLDVMMDINSIDQEENLNDTSKGMNGHVLMSQMHHFNAHGMNPHSSNNRSNNNSNNGMGCNNSNNNIHQTKMSHSDCQESENDYSPTKRTRAPRGRRMESLTARASALTPVEGVRFDPFSYSWYAKYLENENSKEPKISKYLLKKWGFNKAHSLAVHTVKCAYKGVPFTEQELTNIFNVNSKKLMNNQRNFINMTYKGGSYGNNEDSNDNVYNSNNYGTMGIPNSPNGVIIGNMGYVNNTMNDGTTGMIDHMVNEIDAVSAMNTMGDIDVMGGGATAGLVGAAAGLGGGVDSLGSMNNLNNIGNLNMGEIGNFNNNMKAYRGNMNEHGIMNNISTNDLEKNGDMNNMHDEETLLVNGSSNDANIGLNNSMDITNNMLNSMDSVNTLDPGTTQNGILSNCGYSYNNGSNVVCGNEPASQNNYHPGALLPNGGILIGSGGICDNNIHNDDNIDENNDDNNDENNDGNNDENNDDNNDDNNNSYSNGSISCNNGSNNDNNAASIKANCVGNVINNAYMNDQIGINTNADGNKFPSEELAGMAESSGILDDENAKLLNKSFLIVEKNLGNNISGNILRNNSTENYNMLNECMLKSRSREMNVSHSRNNVITAGIEVGEVGVPTTTFDHHLMDYTSAMGSVEPNELNMNAPNDLYTNHPDATYGITSAGSNINVNSEPVINNSIMNKSSSSSNISIINMGSSMNYNNNVVEAHDIMDDKGVIEEHLANQKNYMSEMNKVGNIDNPASNDNNSDNSYVNNPYSQKNISSNFNAYGSENATAGNMIGSNANELNNSSMYYLSAKSEIKTEH
ncbi:transcription factor with AP2 domain(s) [Plasmodium gonderi]|uniref:Transcription factor with AP2 domain(S) n=1 Tax=Plasmodium gonderi TaxID=77519 RepID=A0A1Y1JE14_PLAGO|nr:transcription factor with AP2 domain(s) [Plasmodium gonderi]GAW80500.1 transcription factor with AP2 domain(s) [Plasmodium gonderi]